MHTSRIQDRAELKPKYTFKTTTPRDLGNVSSPLLETHDYGEGFPKERNGNLL